MQCSGNAAAGRREVLQSPCLLHRLADQWTQVLQTTDCLLKLQDALKRHPP